MYFEWHDNLHTEQGSPSKGRKVKDDLFFGEDLMPVHTGKDKKGCFAQWGGQKKYYYECGDVTARDKAKAKAARQGAAAHAAGYKGNVMKYKCECIECGHKVTSNEHCADLECPKCGGQMRRQERPGPGRLQKITANLVGTVRHDQMEGRDFLVAPMVMIVEGVHEGSEGPVYYSKNELAKTAMLWNYKPVVVYHPMKNGEGCSACDPVILSNRKVGVIMNTRIAETEHGPGLKAEAWLEADRMNVVDERIANAVERGEMMELSTGLFVDSDRSPGEWNGEKFDATVTNYRPDHLALLPDLKGACSIEDGAGLLRLNVRPEEIKIVGNEMSHGNVRSLLNSWLRNKDKSGEPYDAYVEDVYDDFFIFTEDGKLYRGNYVVVNNVLEVETAFTEVVRVTEYRTINGEFVGNESNNFNRKDRTMDKKKEMINALIESNSNSWGKDDRETLEAMDEDALEKMQSSEKLAADKAVENAVENYRKEEKAKADEAKAKADAQIVQNTESKAKTVDEYIADAPKEIAMPLRNMMAAYNATKDALVKLLVDNERCTFNEEQLNARDVDELKRLVKLASIEKEERPETLNFFGQGLEPTPVANVETPLVMPAVVNQEPVAAGAEK